MTFPCTVTWPTDPTAAELIPPHLLPPHACVLPAEHVSAVATASGRVFQRLQLMPAELEDTRPVDHVCHCGDQQAVASC